MITVTVFVALIGEGTEVWRPTSARHLGSNDYRLEGNPQDGEVWQFQPDTIVECISHTFADGSTGLVATRVSESVYFCPAVERVISHAQCWEYCFADQGGPTDASNDLKRWIYQTSKFTSLANFHDVCATCIHCQWSSQR